MSILQITPEIRPNRMVHKSKKDKDYHRRMGRWTISATDITKINRLHEKINVAERAYNDRIIQQEDIDAFLLDESKNVRNRTFFTFNLMKTQVEQFRGTMVQTKFNASVQPVTRRTHTRKMLALQKGMLMHSIAEEGANMRRMVASRYPIGETAAETLAKVDASYHDRYLKAMNRLMERQREINNQDMFKADDALRFAMSGLLVSHFKTEGSFVREGRVHPRNFFWDTSWENVDFSDCDYMGVFPLRGLTEIAEIYNPDEYTLRHLDEMSRLYMGGAWFERGLSNTTHQRYRVHSSYWRDLAYGEFGYVNGPGEVPLLVKLDDEDGQKPKYTYNDLIDPPENEENEKLFGDNKFCKRHYEVTRYVDMIPWEYVIAGSEAQINGERPDDLPDIVLDHGLYPLQEYNPFDPKRSVLPVKAQAFALADGEIITPVQASIDPNRFIMRLLSGIENQVNISGGKGGTIDADLLDPSEDPAKVTQKRKNGETIILRTNGRGVQNALGQYDDTPGQGTYAMTQLIGAVEGIIRTVSGAHAPLTGERPEKGQAVGTTEILVQRGALMQEPFYDAYYSWELQKARFYATAGKEYYLEHKDVLYDLVGDDDVVALLLSDDVEPERYNATIRRDNPGDMKRDQANQWMDTLFQMGVMPPKMYFELRGNAYLEDVSAAMRQYAQQLEQAQAEKERAEAKERIQAGLMAQAQQLEEEKRDVFEKQLDAANALAKEGAKEKSALTKEAAKAELQPDPVQTTMPKPTGR